jgi:hypothetical protein
VLECSWSWSRVPVHGHTIYNDEHLTEVFGHTSFLWVLKLPRSSPVCWQLIHLTGNSSSMSIRTPSVMGVKSWICRLWLQIGHEWLWLILSSAHRRQNLCCGRVEHWVDTGLLKTFLHFGHIAYLGIESTPVYSYSSQCVIKFVYLSYIWKTRCFTIKDWSLTNEGTIRWHFLCEAILSLWRTRTETIQSLKVFARVNLCNRFTVVLLSFGIIFRCLGQIWDRHWWPICTGRPAGPVLFDLWVGLVA